MSDNSENFKISVSDGFPIEKALRKFKRMADAYGIVKNYRSRQAYGFGVFPAGALP